MSDTDLSDLFATGTTPERDPAFELWVADGIGRARLRSRLLSLALRAIVVLMLSGAIFAASNLIKPVLVQLVDGSPQFMGVPVPVVLGALLTALAIRTWRDLFAFRFFTPPS